jgi:excisionase family DNA binding protein
MADNGAKHEGSGVSGLPRTADLENRLCIKVTEAAKMLGISRNFAYELVKQHKLPVVKFGKRLLIPRAALEKMLCVPLEGKVGKDGNR